ncbi:putative pentatricopeptide repeat-containing protein At5g08310, mitochondrial [Mercurialis annua]|uniref:putative pentatricopeptide repeat-containing protein At5g08310, mitochondrial n=1 Tax=Mercurialis annua TaxID=3986 RepID=UPI0021604CFD|nr:putative pentatricopeptide repeat-containing protein At5g08310, mitochondrial [Mercurialis annua]XP_050226446.1 putative pentatricopeptide repeat-containing protein At5g08310, mitochondrial [Mercurialis annua]
MALSRITKQTKNLYKLLIKPPINPHYKNLSTYNTTITNDLISIFTRRQFSPDSPELKTLAPLLDTKVVESVLNSFNNWKIAFKFFAWASNQYGYKHSMYTYNAMASILSRARQNAPMKDLAADIINSRCLMTAGALGFFIRCLGDVSLADEANFLFDQVKTMGLCIPNSYSYNCLLEAFSSSSSNCVDLVEMRLKEMRDHGFSFSKYTLTPVLQVYCNAGKFDEALNVFNEIHSHGWVDEYIISILVLSFCKLGHVDKAFEFVERMEELNFRLTEKTFCNLIHGFVRQSRVDKGLQLLYKMQKNGFVPDIALYDVLIGGLCSNKELDKALALYSEMKMLNILPDVGIIRKLVSSFSEAKYLISILGETLGDVDGETRTSLCNSVLSSLVQSGSIHKACCLLESMMGNRNGDDFQFSQIFQDNSLAPNSASFSIVINGLLQACKLDLALCLFRDMAKIGCDRELLIYNNLIDGLCNSDRLEESCQLLREMEDSGLKPTQFTLNSIFGCLCRRENVSGALDLVKKMRFHGHEPWVKHYSLLVRKLCKHGNTTKACIFLTDMVQEGFPPNVIAYSALLSGLIQIQKVDEALKIFKDITDREHCPDLVAYNILIKGLCESHRIAEAQNLFNEMVMKGLVPSVVTYNSLIDGWCKSGCIDNAMNCLSSMSAKEREPNVITYTTLINGLFEARRLNDAVMLWNEMGRKGSSPNRVAFMAYIYGFCKCGKPEIALVHLHEMVEKEMEPDAYVYIAIISTFLNDSNFPMAFEVLKEMVNIKSFPDLLPKKSYIILRDTIVKLSENATTSSSIKSLIAAGSIPAIFLSENDDKRLS